MHIQRLRYVIHPDDALDLQIVTGDESLSEISVILDLSSNKPFITQVNERLTIADPSVTLEDEFVVHPFREDD